MPANPRSGAFHGLASMSAALTQANIIRLWHNVMTKRLSLRGVPSTTTVPAFPQSTCPISPNHCLFKDVVMFYSYLQ